MIDTSELQLMVEAARAYYEQEQTQEQVGCLLGVSRSKVSRLLQRARREGIVQVRINDPSSTQSSLERALVEAFHLDDARVVLGQLGGEHLTCKSIGLAGAHYLQDILTHGQKVGVGWGRTLQATVTALRPVRTARISVVPMIGGLRNIAPAFQVHELARELAQAFGGVWQPFYAPALVGDKAAWSFIVESDDFQQLAHEWEKLDVAVVGIGNVDFDAQMEMLFADYLDEETQGHLKEAEAVGDLCVRFFDIQGRPCPEVVKYVVGIKIEQLQSVPRVIGIAGGVHKSEALLGALRGGYLDVVITDEAAARGALHAGGCHIPSVPVGCSPA